MFAERREKLLNAVEAFLRANFAASLTAITASWDDDLVTLAQPQTWAMGYRRELLSLPFSAYPLICLILGETTPELPRAPQGLGAQDSLTKLAVTWTVAHEDPDAAYRYKERYAQALVHCLRRGRELAGHARVDVFPAIPRLWELDVIELPAGATDDLSGNQWWISSGQIVTSWR